MAAKKVTKQRVRASEARRQEEKLQRNRQRVMTALIIIVVVLAIAAVWYFISQYVGSEDQLVQDDTERTLSTIEPSDRDGYFSTYPEMIIDSSREYDALIQTDVGDMRLRLYSEEAPLAVNSFIFLAEQGFYDNTIFHRVIDNFMAQAGDPTGLGYGGAGYSFEDEVDNELSFNRPGILGMANSGPNTNGSGFFITLVPTPHLDGLHTIFGELIEGEDVLNSIILVEPGVPPAGSQQPTVINRIDIIEQ